MWLLATLVNFIFFLQVATAKKGVPDKTNLINKVERVSLYSCYVGLRKLPWQYTLANRFSDYTCEYTPAFESFVYCIYQNNQENGNSTKILEKSFEQVRRFCDIPRVLNKTDSDFYHALNNGTKYMQSQITSGANITYPVQLDTKKRKQYYRAYYGYYYNYDSGNYFGGYICAYFFGILLLAGAFRLVRYTPLQKVLFKQKLVNYIRGYLILPTLGKKHADPFSYLKVITGYLPTRFETLVVTGYLIMHTVFMSCNYIYDPLNVIFKSHAIQVSRFVADRSGVLSFAHFPLIVLFAGRNNFLEMISGLHYTSFIVFHKWLGRVMFLDAVIHSAAYTNYTLLSQTYKRRKTRTYWKFGIAATILAAGLMLTSVAAFRRHYYETFLFMHIVLGALFFYACWQHVMTISGIEWVYAAIAIWVVDRLVRIVRLCFLGFPKAQITLIGEDLIRVTVPKSAKFWKAKPGQYVFLSFLHPLCFWQSHPFTVMDSCSKEDELVIIFKEKKGVTRVLKKYLARNNGKASMRVAVEGPYGHSSPVQRFDNVLLLTGGSGWPGPIAHAINLGKSSAASGKSNVQLVAAVKGFDTLEAYMPELTVLKNLNVDLHLYNTKPPSPIRVTVASTDKTEEPGEKTSSVEEGWEQASSSDQSIPDLEFATVHQGRPDVEQVINACVKQPGKTAIVSCGPPAFVDAIRNKTAEAVIKNPSSVIEYFEEYQVW
ncbi:ferric-chelate reductase TDEL_0D06600 [Torulaspora delbrueckii]|uniref:ferric-chelate reductase (NADPH) n=1 Tax=Torulaspora delbrueckii TaxID=4950 RepID=G8ZUF0_TORDE|nr:hypothetical protein TDEL_0D06600 [Torulaspora delbrueckii]CCE92244.1 hypothetical protein TDEL_0D06600 [Torulaspora delbrueckii]